MIRTALLLLLLALPARAEQAAALVLDPSGIARDGTATGALVWVHPFARELPAPEAPEVARQLVGLGYDLWRFDRAGGPDPLAEGAARLAAGTAALRARGYRRVVLLGESRGAFIILVALRNPGLAEAAILAAPAAHGRSPDRRPQALTDFAAALAAAQPGPRLALFLFAEDAWDPDPAARAALFSAATRRLGTSSLLVDRPAEPTGHGGLAEPAFGAIFGACLARFLDLDRPPPAACP